MSCKNITMAVLLILGTHAVPVSTAAAQTRLGLHVTQEELNIWKQRAVSGPYKTTGDVSANSPGDWTRILNNANSFVSNASNERWSGQPASSCWSHRSSPPSLPGRNWGERMRDAGFVYLLTGTTSYRDAVLTELLAQAATAGTNWTDSVRWNTNGTECLYGDSYSWQITQWLTKLLYAYDYIRPSISAGNRTTLDTWFTNVANLFNTAVHIIIRERFPNRDSDDYTTWGRGYPVCLGAYLTHYNGYRHCGFHEGWSNRSGSHVRFFGLTGIVVNNTTLKTRAKRWVKEWVRFANFADSTMGEMYRSIENAPGNGFDYSAVMIGEMIVIADAYARNGDLELYNYSTSLGSPDGGLTPAGGPKSILSITKKLLDYVDHTVIRYGTTSSSLLDNAHIIDTIDETTGARFISDTNVVPGNVFWNDARVKSIYLRQAANTPAYPANPSNGGYCAYCGEWGTLPGVLFMFGQMEGKVSPYGGTTSNQVPAQPSSLVIQSQ